MTFKFNMNLLLGLTMHGSSFTNRFCKLSSIKSVRYTSKRKLCSKDNICTVGFNLNISFPLTNK